MDLQKTRGKGVILMPYNDLRDIESLWSPILPIIETFMALASYLACKNCLQIFNQLM